MLTQFWATAQGAASYKGKHEIMENSKKKKLLVFSIKENN